MSLDLPVPGKQIRTNENNFLYENNGDGSFTKITDGDIVNDSGNSESASWTDYNNDGNIDLFVANYNGDNFLYNNNFKLVLNFGAMS